LAADRDTLSQLHTAVAQNLLKKIENGEATASDLNVARQMLKDNGIESLPTPDNPIGNLAEELPFDPEQEESEEA